jgi:hypothetical protein
MHTNNAVGTVVLSLKRLRSTRKTKKSCTPEFILLPGFQREPRTPGKKYWMEPTKDFSIGGKIKKKELKKTVRRNFSRPVIKDYDLTRSIPRGQPRKSRSQWSQPFERWETPLFTQTLKRQRPGSLSVGDFVSWNSSGGRARGKITRITSSSTLNIPDSSVSVEGTEDDPAALIRVYRDGEPTETIVGHKFSTLTKIDPIQKSSVQHSISCRNRRHCSY